MRALVHDLTFRAQARKPAEQQAHLSFFGRERKHFSAEPSFFFHTTLFKHLQSLVNLSCQNRPPSLLTIQSF
jgi:hypothetical protein